MRHKVVIVGLTCAFASPATAELKIEGMVSAGPYVSWSTDGAQGWSNAVTDTNNQDAERVKKGFSKHGITSNNSRISVSSDLDLTSWLKVLFKYELDIGDSGAPLSSTGARWVNSALMRTRDSYLGLGGWWGALKWGTNQNAYEQYLYEADPLDNATGIGGNMQMFGTPGYGVVYDVGQMWLDPQRGQAGFYRRTDQNIWYESPDLQGFTFSAAYSMNAYQRDTSELPYKPQVFSAGAQYKPSYLPFYANVAYEVHQDMFGLNLIAGNPNKGTTSLDSGIKGQVGGTLSIVTVGVIVEHLKYTVEDAVSLSEYQRTAFGVHAKVVLPFGYIGASAGHARNGTYKGLDPTSVPPGTEVIPPDTAVNSGAVYFGLGYFHKIGEQTQLQFTGTMIENQASASYALPSGATPNVVAGARHRAVYTGVRYTF